MSSILSLHVLSEGFQMAEDRLTMEELVDNTSCALCGWHIAAHKFGKRFANRNTKEEVKKGYRLSLRACTGFQQPTSPQGKVLNFPKEKT